VCARRIVGPVFLTKKLIAKIYTSRSEEIISEVTKEERLSYCPHCMYIYADFFSDIFGNRMIRNGI
jgi:hypothetical protein